MASIHILAAPTDIAEVDLKHGMFGPHTDYIHAVATAPDWEFEIRHRAADKETLEMMIAGARSN